MDLDSDHEQEHGQAPSRSESPELVPSQSQSQSQKKKEDMWDPDQSQAERRDIRRQYREMLDAAAYRKANINDVTADELTKAINDSASVFARVRQPAEATMDSRFLVETSDAAAIKARSFKIDQKAFNVDDFLQRVKMFGYNQPPGQQQDDEDDDDDEEGGGDASQRLMGEREKAKRRREFWGRIGWRAAQRSYRVPAVDLILGPLSMERKERKKPARQARASQANQPSIEEQEEVEQLEGSEMALAGEKATAKQIKKTMAALQEATETDENGDAIGMNLFKFFIHPTDFAQSVENLFYLSFLIKSGEALLDTDSGDCMISSCEPLSEEQKREWEAGGFDHSRKQLVFDFDMAMWREAIEIYDITESYLPDRNSPNS